MPAFEPSTLDSPARLAFGGPRQRARLAQALRVAQRRLWRAIEAGHPPGSSAFESALDALLSANALSRPRQPPRAAAALSEAFAKASAQPLFLSRLLAAGLSPNTTLSDGQTPLQKAAAAPKEHVWRVEALLRSGADPNPSNHEDPPLILAAARANPRAVELLLRAGANPNAISPFYPAQRPLLAALPPLFSGLCFEGPERLLCAELLLQAGADPDQPNAEGASPLQLALLGRHEAFARKLIELGADTLFLTRPDPIPHPLVRDQSGFLDPFIELALARQESDALAHELANGLRSPSAPERRAPRL